MSSDPNPIVALANRLRAQRELEAAADAGVSANPQNVDRSSAETLLRAFTDELNAGATRLAAILGPRAIRVVRLEAPLRVRVRFRGREDQDAPEQRVSFDLDAARELVLVSGLDLDGEYQFDSGAAVPSLINLSKLSTEEGYGSALTPSSVLKRIARDAELPPPQLDEGGPLRF